MKILFVEGPKEETTMLHQTAYISATIFSPSLLLFLCRELHSEYEEIDVVAGKKLGKEGSRHKVKVVMRCENGWFSFTEGEKESASSNTTTRKPVIRINDEKEGRFYEYTKHRIYN